MTYKPSPWLESLAERLIPPGSAEHTLGDIAESSQSGKEYFTNLLSVLPSSIWCQLRRRTNWIATVVIALISGYAMGAATAYFDSAFLDNPSGWLRLTVPWLIWIGGGLLASAYGPAGNIAKSNWRVLGAASVAALVVAALLGVPVAGVATGMALVVCLIVLLTMPWTAGTPVTGPPTLETLPVHARVFQRTIRWRNARESVVALILVAFNLDDVVFAVGPQRTEAILLVAGLLFVALFIHLGAGPRKVPEGGVDVVLRFHRHELQRQRDLLRAVPLWYLLPLVPGLSASIINNWEGPGDLFGFVVMGGVLALVWWLNVAGARWLENQIRDVQALEETIQ